MSALVLPTDEEVYDCHGHVTTKELADAMQVYHKGLLADGGSYTSLHAIPLPDIPDEMILEFVTKRQLNQMDKRGVKKTFFSPRASAMRPDLGDRNVSELWTQASNHLVYRITKLFPGRFIGVGQLPQSPGTSMKASADEMERCVKEYGFVGFNLNPDSSGGKRAEPIMSDRYWHPALLKAVELDVPFMVHVSASCLSGEHSTGEAYLRADISAFVNLIELSVSKDSTLFKGDLKDLKMIIPHGGGGVVQHWGRFEGMLQDSDRPPLAEALGKNIFFDTCVYWRPGMEVLFRSVNPENLLFGSETIGALRENAIDPESKQHRDDTYYLIRTLLIPDKGDPTRNIPLAPDVMEMVLSGNHKRVYPRAAAKLVA